MPELKMKECKECGKMFTPTSNKQKYCSADHYRPCPVCGKLMFAKYLSDPARCCSGSCKSKLGKLNKKQNLAIEQYVKNDVAATLEAYSNLVPMPGAEKLSDLKEEYEHQVDESKVKTFIGESKFGFITGHEYEVEYITEGKGQHMMQATYDVTADQHVAIRYVFTNKKHISKMFK